MMEFLDPKKRKAHRRKLFIGYGLVAIALAMMTTVLVFAAYGFDVNRKTGQIIQNGMIIVDAHPESAQIAINGKNQGSTSKRFPLPAGQYTVDLSRDGYRSWSHAVNLEGGSIEQLVYPFLFPTNLVTTSVRDYSKTPQVVSQSPDRRWLLVEVPGSRAGRFQFVDLNDKKTPSTDVSLPSAVLSAGKTHSMKVVEWSTDNTNVLLRHTYDTHTEYIVLNRSKPERSQNITKLFSQHVFTSASLHDKHADKLYLYNKPDKSLSLATVDSKTVSVVAKSVFQYKTYQKDLVMYVTGAPDTSKANIHLLHKGVDAVVKTVAVSPKYLLDAADFNGEMYVAVGSTNEQKVYLFLDPLNKLDASGKTKPEPFRALRLQGVTQLAFSTNARFLEIQAGSAFTVFDAETDRQFQYDTKLPVTAGQAATWMDGHRLALVGQDKRVHIFDFDGTNKQKLNAAVAGTDVYFDRDYKALYVIAPGSGNNAKASLTRTELKVTP